MTATSIIRKTSKAMVLPAGLVTYRRRGDLVILLYHRVGPGRSEIDLTAPAFERQLEYLATNDRVVPLDQALSDRNEGGVVITFDDGYRDFSETVLPMLVRYQIPALLYLATGLIGGSEGEAGSEALSWPALADAVSTGLVTVGSHTHNHVDLSKADQRTSEEEIRRSKELIEDRLGKAVRHFAYPYGVGSAIADRTVRDLFDSAALDGWRTNRKGRTDRYRLARAPVLRSDGQLFFRARLRGFLDAEALLYRALGRGPWRKR